LSTAVITAPATGKDGSEGNRRAQAYDGRPAASADLIEAIFRPSPTLIRDTLRDAGRTAATLGLYTFHAKTALRRRLWSSVSIDGRPLSYIGTARELWMPALMIAAGVASLVFIVFFVKWLIGPLPKPPLSALRSPWRFGLSVPLLVVLALSTWRVRDFLLKRTERAGRTGYLPGETRMRYALEHFGATIATGFTVGWALPWRRVRLHTRLMDEATFAGMHVSVAGSSKPLYRWFFVPWIGGLAAYLGSVIALGILHGPKIIAASKTLALPAFGAGEWLSAGAIMLAGTILFQACLAVYQAAEWRQIAAMTRLDGRPLSLDLATGPFVVMQIATTALRLLSLGLLSPVAHAIKVRHLLSRLSLAPADTRVEPRPAIAKAA
jgi:uncharacterized membrane protein YjgN (DUF898 family)